jgi:hypothetical protein
MEEKGASLPRSMPSMAAIYTTIGIGKCHTGQPGKPDARVGITASACPIRLVMHRDIKPMNLGVVGLTPIYGVLLNLDDAIKEQTSTDHSKGTLLYPQSWSRPQSRQHSLDSDEMSPLYENRSLTVGLVQMRLRQSPAEC